MMTAAYAADEKHMNGNGSLVDEQAHAFPQQPSALQEYLRRYEQLERERLANEFEWNSEAMAHTVLGWKKNQDTTNEVVNDRHNDSNEWFETVPVINQFPRSASTFEPVEPKRPSTATTAAEAKAGEEEEDFTDAATFFANEKTTLDDSFVNHIDHGDSQSSWQDDATNEATELDGRRSEFFEKKSCNLQTVDFMATEEEKETTVDTIDAESASEQSLHLDKIKFTLTPLSIKYLQEKSQRPPVQQDEAVECIDSFAAAQTFTRSLESQRKQLVVDASIEDHHDVECVKQGQHCVEEAMMALDEICRQQQQLAIAQKSRERQATPSAHEKRRHKPRERSSTAFMTPSEYPTNEMRPKHISPVKRKSITKKLEYDVQEDQANDQHTNLNHDTNGQKTVGHESSESDESEESDHQTEAMNGHSHVQNVKSTKPVPVAHPPAHAIKRLTASPAVQRRHLSPSTSPLRKPLELSKPKIPAPPRVDLDDARSTAENRQQTRSVETQVSLSLNDLKENQDRSNLQKCEDDDHPTNQRDPIKPTSQSSVSVQTMHEQPNGTMKNPRHQRSTSVDSSLSFCSVATAELLAEADSLSTAMRKASTLEDHKVLVKESVIQTDAVPSTNNKTNNQVDLETQHQAVKDHEPKPGFARMNGSALNTSQEVQSIRLRDMVDMSAQSASEHPVKKPRRCRRLFCAVGEIMVEHVTFTNSGDGVARICFSLIPLSVGCQQFTITPAVLELPPRQSGSFAITFVAEFAGPVAGILQFRGVGTDTLFAPYELIVEALVRSNNQLESHDNQSDHVVPQQRKTTKMAHVEELGASDREVDIRPTFLQFARAERTTDGFLVQPLKVRVRNGTDRSLPFKVKCRFENMRISPRDGIIKPHAETILSVVPISRPFTKSRRDSISPPATPTTKWCGSFTIEVDKKRGREVSVLVDPQVLARLPSFNEIARLRHGLSSQTDAFYYTKKINRRGLYFHARAVECGSCVVGESHQVPVYVCNGSDSPMTVFLQELMEPFSCSYTTTTIQPKKFIEVPVTFTPKVRGKVSTTLVAYSLAEKAGVTLIARGI